MTNAVIQTYTGRGFNPFCPDPHLICIEDIAHSLSLLCRFNGHCKTFYSVAEHSVWVSRLVAPEYALWGLLHDAGEAYFGDVMSPLKPYLNQRFIERGLNEAVAVAFGLSLPMPESIHDADHAMLITERVQVMRPSRVSWPEGPAADVQLECWSPPVAEWKFLEQFNSLRGR